MLKGVFAAGLALIASCQYSRPDDLPPDAATDAPTDAPVDARPDLVSGRWDWIHVTGDAAVARGQDLSTLQFQAMVPDGNGYRTVNGSLDGPGAFHLEGVTPGVGYILRAGRLAYFTDQHEVQLGTAVSSRFDSVVPMNPTAVDVQLSNVPAIAATDRHLVVSRRADCQADLIGQVGSTELNVTFDWRSDTQPTNTDRCGLPSAAAGDDLWILDYRTTTASIDSAVTQAVAIVGAADFTGTSIVDGQPLVLRAAMTEPSRALRISSAVNLDLFGAGHSAFARPVRAALRCSALPGPAAGWTFDGSPRLGPVVFEKSTNLPAPTFFSGSGDYPDPFPEAWTRWCHVEYVRQRTFRRPDAPGTISLFPTSHRVSAPPAIASTPISPPTGIRVNGQDGEAGGLLRNTGGPVSVTWTGVSLATQYAVHVYELRTQATPRVVVSATVSETHVDLPAELLAGATYVALAVTAWNASNTYATGELAPSGVPGASATTVTAMFRWSATCGDGSIDVGEDCDDGGATATCDVDCTTRVCGDGTRNAVAGELCDSIVDTPGCDSDCTANTCGDGHLNPTTEQCDDGNTTPGDGCSAICTTE